MKASCRIATSPAQIYRGQEVQPNNFRVPQLTYKDDHPGEDLPAFRYAFEVTADGRVGELKPSSTVGQSQAR